MRMKVRRPSALPAALVRRGFFTKNKVPWLLHPGADSCIILS
jgi:hypothetical protein